MRLHPDLRQLALANEAYQRVLLTGQHLQVMLISLPPAAHLGVARHPEADELLVVVAGEAKVQVGDRLERVDVDDVVLVPAGADHDVWNVGPDDVKGFIVYSRPLLPPQFVRDRRGMHGIQSTSDWVFAADRRP